MKLQLHPVQLPLKRPFTIARGTIRHQQSLIVSLQSGDFCGYGEVTCNAYYRHDFASLSASLRHLEPLLEPLSEFHPSTLYAECESRIPGDRFALAAIDAAAHDLFGKIQGVPTYETLGLRWKGVVRSSYTLGIDTIETMVAKLHEEPEWPIYKIKLGTPRDEEIVRALRRETDAVIRVDANCGWSAEQTVENSKWLADLGIEFIEQPLPCDAPDAAKRYVYEHSALPVLADESCRIEADVIRCRDFFHGINVKLCKCGGPTPAARMLQEARSYGMRTMVGCMIESSVAISAAAQLLPLLDYADLDGAVLLASDPASGVRVERGHVVLPDRCGNGVRLAENLQDWRVGADLVPSTTGQLP
ncbi:dipeptide epimerase [Planctomicrobium sp. SH664]|uniref:dipeptide epimerase n=1 Tax=Planctomicrobium sp. SH664 TaxID=3448125 RepID=UPI003F5C211F